MKNLLLKVKEKGVNKFIICFVFCLAVLMGICPETDTHILRSKQDGVNVICAPASAYDAEVATRETLGQGSSIMRAQFRLQTDEERFGRNHQVFYLCITAVLPGFFLSICRILFEFGERSIKRIVFIIRFIHDLDGRKWVVS